MELGNNIPAMIGSITAALIAGGISYVHLVNGKEQNIAQVRQAWIEAITADIALFLSQVDVILRLAELESPDRKTPLSDDQLKRLRNKNKDNYQQLNESYSRICLRLDASNPEHREVLDGMDALYKAFYGPCDNMQQIVSLKERLMQRLVTNTQGLGSVVWGRIKRGDVSYQRLTLALLAFMMLTLIAALVIYLSQTAAPASPRRADSTTPAAAAQSAPAAVMPAR